MDAVTVGHSSTARQQVSVKAIKSCSAEGRCLAQIWCQAPHAARLTSHTIWKSGQDCRGRGWLPQPILACSLVSCECSPIEIPNQRNSENKSLTRSYICCFLPLFSPLSGVFHQPRCFIQANAGQHLCLSCCLSFVTLSIFCRRMIAIKSEQCCLGWADKCLSAILQNGDERANILKKKKKKKSSAVSSRETF